MAGISVHGQQQGKKNPHQAWSAEVVGKCDNFQFPGQGQKARLVDPDQRGAVGLTDTIGRSQAQTVISESGFYPYKAWERIRKVDPEVQTKCQNFGFPGQGQKARLLDPNQKSGGQISTPGGLQSLAVISESGFYEVVVRNADPQDKQLPAAWPPG